MGAWPKKSKIFGVKTFFGKFRNLSNFIWGRGQKHVKTFWGKVENLVKKCFWGVAKKYVKYFLGNFENFVEKNLGAWPKKSKIFGVKTFFGKFRKFGPNFLGA